MYKELNTLGVEDFNYFSLIRKSDNVEVYTSKSYKREDCSEILDIEKIQNTLNYYFERVNSGIEQQKQSPKLTEDQKKELKFLEKSDYKVQYKKFMPNGVAENIYWTKEASEFLNN